MRVYTVDFCLDYEGCNSIVAFTKEADAERLRELFEENKRKNNDPYLYGDYITITELDVFSGVDDYLQSDSAYDPFEVYGDADPLESETDE